MADREIVGVVWHTLSHQIDIIYGCGTREHVQGPHRLAAALAADAGLELMPARSGVVSWVRPQPDPEGR